MTENVSNVKCYRFTVLYCGKSLCVQGSVRKVTATIDHLLLPYYSVKNASGFMFGRPAAFQKSVAELLLG